MPAKCSAYEDGRHRMGSHSGLCNCGEDDSKYAWILALIGIAIMTVPLWLPGGFCK